jgi:hypothetical protein
LKHPAWLVVVVLSLLAGGCPIPALVCAFGVDERTVALWQQQAGPPARQIQQHVVCQGQVDGGQGPGDALDVKTPVGTLWMATAMRVFSRLFRGGAVAPPRDTRLITQVGQPVRAAAQIGQPILGAVDGLAAWSTAILRVFRDPVFTGNPGRPPLMGWADLHLVQGVKQSTGRRLVGIERRRVHGCLRGAAAIMQTTQVGLGVITTAYIERLNATFRTWLPALTRRSRTPARQLAQLEAALCWMGCVYNCCRVHTTLHGTPAMAADLTDHVWSVDEFTLSTQARVAPRCLVGLPS